MISYAQNYEDVILRRVFRDRKTGFYIDVGAMDPTEDSVTKYFYDEGWNGINIEPNEYFYNRLVTERPRDINLKLAVGEMEEMRTLHVFETFGNSTFDERSRDNFAANGFDPQQSDVRVTTLASICREYVKQEIDFLKIDCEGWEKKVLEGADWEHFRPTILIIEATEPGSTRPAWEEWEHLLTQAGRYEMVYFDGLNRYYLRREYRDLRSHFQTPPNIFDAFTPKRAAVAEQANAICQQERSGILARLARLDEEMRTLLIRNAEQATLLHGAEQVRVSLERELEQLRPLREYAQELERKIAELDSVSDILRRDLTRARLWIGQLSQDLAARQMN